MNNLGGVIEAYKVFRRDLQEDEDFIFFKENSVKSIISEEVEERVFFNTRYNRSMGSVLVKKEIKVFYGVPDVQTIETRRKNRELLKQVDYEAFKSGNRR